jgi:hypothetical protein
MWCCVDIVLTEVSKERIASIFREEDKKKSASEPAWAAPHPRRLLSSSSNKFLQMETTKEERQINHSVRCTVEGSRWARIGLDQNVL